jgi:glycosyltransferase involved in cell wall biosynthesis
MPNALLEAMAASRAVAARDDEAAFAAALSRLLRDPAKRIELGRRNRERVVAAFSQARMFTAYSLIFGLNEGA